MRSKNVSVNFVIRMLWNAFEFRSCFVIDCEYVECDSCFGRRLGEFRPMSLFWFWCFGTLSSLDRALRLLCRMWLMFLVSFHQWVWQWTADGSRGLCWVMPWWRNFLVRVQPSTGWEMLTASISILAVSVSQLVPGWGWVWKEDFLMIQQQIIFSWRCNHKAFVMGCHLLCVFVLHIFVFLCVAGRFTWLFSDGVVSAGWRNIVVMLNFPSPPCLLWPRVLLTEAQVCLQASIHSEKLVKGFVGSGWS